MDAETWPPPLRSLRRLTPARSRGCARPHDPATPGPLWRTGTQTVFGEGPGHAPLLIVGEQPGDREDLAGHPFVGPAGRILDQALEASGIDRDQVYVTNAVKHFKWELRGKRRLHKTPAQREIEACLPWLEAEIAAVKPRVVLCLGGTAARGVLGKPVKIASVRGRFLPTTRGEVIVTVHPAYLLRLREGKEEAFGEFARDVARAAEHALPR